MSDSWTGVSISARSGHFSILPVSPSWSAWSHGVTAAVTPWLQADHDGLTGKMLKWPERGEIDTPVQESLIVELYSK